MVYTLDFSTVFKSYDVLLAGAWLTIELSAAAMALGLIVAVFGALAKLFGPGWLKALVDAYIEIIRNTPFLIQIFLVYFGLPLAGLRLEPVPAALLAMVVNVGAYAIEIVRAGIDAIPRGQISAGFALGLGRLQVFRYVMIRPALRKVFPALTSQFIWLMLGSSVVSAISADDLTQVASNLASSNFKHFEIYIVVTGMYLVMTLLFSGVFALIRRWAFSYPEGR
ncbi:MAG TPA: amino acid ABC transporter permease [Bordetella sp.]